MPYITPKENIHEPDRMKRKTLLTAIAAGLLVYAGLSYLGSTRAAPVYTIESEIILPADAERSWQVLTDFAKYPEWNPYVPRAEADFTPGATISFTIVDGNFTEPLDLRAELGEIDPPEQFYWVGTLGIRGLHDTRHGFALQPLEGGKTRLRHFEEFRGILPFLLPGRDERVATTRASFDKMNQALQSRLER
jgi:hypothetical protein